MSLRASHAPGTLFRAGVVPRAAARTTLAVTARAHTGRKVPALVQVRP
jgi:hypothetical protein